jgi:hypothetical protein
MPPSTPPRKTARREYDTIKRGRFFNAFDSKAPSTSLGEICRRPEIDIPPSTARTWIRTREILGSPALRRTRRIAAIPGPKPLVSASDLETITDQENPIHEKSYKDQVEELGLKCKPSTLQHHANKAGAKRFKKAYTTEISEKNLDERVQYGQEHKEKTLTGFWQYIWFTDEVHMLSAKLQNKPEYELRYPGQKRRLESLKTTLTSGLNITIHVSAGISYNRKGRLMFYKDPKEPSQKTYKPRKPRKSGVQTKEEYEKIIEEWTKDQSAGIEIIPKGNAMTQKFYAEKILPQHIDQIKSLEAHYQHQFYLQEDGDPSHGNKSTNNPCARLKKDAGLQILIHPAQSPDLNPIESLWQIIKQRLRGGKWNTVAEFKAAIQAEWDRITMAQIRRRIREMPWRCQRVIELNGARIRSELW